MAHQGPPSAYLLLLLLGACTLLSLSRHVSSAHIGAAHNLAVRHVAAHHVATHRGIPQRRLQGRGLERESPDDVRYRYGDVDDENFNDSPSETSAYSHKRSRSHFQNDGDGVAYSDSNSADSDSDRRWHRANVPLLSSPQRHPSYSYGRSRLQETTGAYGDAQRESFTGSKETGRKTSSWGSREDKSSNKADPLVQVLTYISACPDPHFSCIRPVESPVPGKPGQCVPYEPTQSDIMGSFTITWSDSPSLPKNTVVAVCTAVEFWTLPHCRGAKMRVVMPNLAQVLLQAKSTMGASGELLRLGYSGPWPSQASVESVACANVTTWHTGNTRSLASEGDGSEASGDSSEGEGFEGEAEMEYVPEEIVRARLAAHRISFGLTLLLAFAAAVVLLALFGILLAYTCGDTLEALVGEDEKGDEGPGTGGQRQLNFDVEGGVMGGSNVLGVGMGLGQDGNARLPSQAAVVKGLRQLIRQLALTPGRQILVRLSQPLLGLSSGQGQVEGMNLEPLLGPQADLPLQEVGRSAH